MAMAMNGKVRLDCCYASNPYHECTQTCIKRIAEGRGRTDRKKKENGSVIKDGVLNKKYDDKRVHRGCTRASNPYHECNENCVERIAAAEGREGIKEPGSFLDIKLGRKKMTESRTMPPSRENANVLAGDKIYNSSATMPPTRFPSSDKVEPQHEKRRSSDVHPGEIHEEDPPFTDKLIHFPFLVPASGVLATDEDPKDPPKEAVKSRSKEPPIHQKADENHHRLAGEGPYPSKGETRNGTTGSAPGSMSFTFSGAADSDDEDAQSFISDASVSVGKYRVKERLASILQSIFNKYGDIAANCQLESTAMRSYYLECVCFVVQELQTTQIMELSRSKVKEMLAILKDAESIGMNVGWLRSVLNENAEALELISQHRAMEVAKTSCDKDLESTRKKLESQLEDLALKEKQVADAQSLIAETRAQLRELELKSSVLSDTVGAIQSKVEALNGKSMLDGVL